MVLQVNGKAFEVFTTRCERGSVVARRFPKMVGTHAVWVKQPTGGWVCEGSGSSKAAALNEAIAKLAAK